MKRLLRSCVQITIKLVVQPPHFVRRFNGVLIHEPVSKSAFKNKGQRNRQRGHRGEPKEIHLCGRQLSAGLFQTAEIGFQLHGCLTHDLLFATRFTRIVGQRIGVGDGHDHRQMAELPEVHILHLLIRDFGFSKQGGKALGSFRFFARNFGEGGGLNPTRRERRIQHAVPDSAACARKAAQETDPVRKQELEKMAEMMTRVPWGPATSFYDACETAWAVCFFLFVEGAGPSITWGRFDQYMYPYYKADIEKGILTPEA